MTVAPRPVGAAPPTGARTDAPQGAEPLAVFALCLWVSGRLQGAPGARVGPGLGQPDASMAATAALQLASSAKDRSRPSAPSTSHAWSGATPSQSDA